MSEAEAPPPGEDDFRVRVARQKREKMRQRLLQATMNLCAEMKSAGPLVIDDVVQEAKVSRGTFYKYFDTIDEAIAALGKGLVDELVVTIGALVRGERDPAMWVCMGAISMLVRASIDPAWAGFVAHTVHVSSDSSVVAGMRATAEAGRKAGLFVYDNPDVAVDFHAGLTLQALRRVRQSPYDESYVLEMAALALSGLGVERVEAMATARRALDKVLALGPERLSWWPSDLQEALAAAPVKARNEVEGPASRAVDRSLSGASKSSL